MTKERIHGHLMIFTANVIFGINTPVSKWLLAEKFTPQLHIYLRMLFAGVLFWIFSLFMPKEKVSLKDLGLLVVCGLCGVAMNQYFFIRGLSLTSSVNAALIVTSTPIFVMIFSAIILKEPISSLKILGISSGITGAVWLILSSQNGAHISGNILGDFFALASTFIYSIYFVISKPLSQKYSAVTIMKWMFLFATIALTPICGKSVLDANSLKGSLDFKTIAAFVYVFAGATFLAYMLIPMALKRMRPTTASMYNYLQPIIASLIAVIFLGDDFTVSKFCASMLIFLGVFLVTKSRRAPDTIATENNKI